MSRSGNHESSLPLHGGYKTPQLIAQDPKKSGVNAVMTNYKSRKNEVPVTLANGSTVPLVGSGKRDAELGEGYSFTDSRTHTHPTSDSDTLIHLLKGSLGSGILAMPMAFANAGLGFGLFATVFVGIVCTYCVHILVQNAHIIYVRTKVPALSYSEVAESAFLTGPPRFRKYSRLAKFLIDMFLVVDLLGCCCVYIVFVARSLKQVWDNYFDSDYNIRIYMIILLPLLLMVNLIRKLKHLAPLSLLANAFIAVGMGITFYYILTDLPPISSRPHFEPITKLPTFFGTAIFALEGIGVVMSLENNMSEPTHFIGCPGVLNIGMAFVVALYASVGFFGYWKYGNETEASITLNLPTEEGLAQSVKIMIGLAIFFTYSLQFYVPMEIIWKKVKPRFPNHQISGEYILRIILVIATMAFAIAVPNLGGFISLVGAVCLSMLGLIFPAVIELVTMHEDPGMGKFKWRLWKNIFLICFGIIGFLTGTYVSLQDIVDTWE